MKLRHKLISKLIDVMGKIYVILDSRLPPETGPILGMEIDADFEGMTRKELCNHIEKKFRLEKDAFWNLQSTQKIRFCCQKARELMSPSKMDMGY
jgi:hypothetical protein